jgi:hypothetical protein
MDLSPPFVLSNRFVHWPSHQMQFQTSENVTGSIDIDDLTLVNLTTGATTFALGMISNPATNVTTFFTSPPFLPDGNYRATLNPSGVTDAAGNPLSGPSVLEFFVLTGDVNRDRSVDGTDFALLAANFGKSGRTYEHGDLDGNTVVNGTDFALLAGNFGKTLPAPAALAPATLAPAPLATGTVTSPAASPIVSGRRPVNRHGRRRDEGPAGERSLASLPRRRIPHAAREQLGRVSAPWTFSRARGR